MPKPMSLAAILPGMYTQCDWCTMGVETHGDYTVGLTPRVHPHGMSEAAPSVRVEVAAAAPEDDDMDTSGPVYPADAATLDPEAEVGGGTASARVAH